jgi:hypothetical protein
MGRTSTANRGNNYKIGKKQSEYSRILREEVQNMTRAENI